MRSASIDLLMITASTCELDIEHMARTGCSFVYAPNNRVDPRRRHQPPRQRGARRRECRARHRRTMVDYSVDMVEQMKGVHADAACAPSRSDAHAGQLTIEMATISAAKALGAITRSAR